MSRSPLTLRPELGATRVMHKLAVWNAVFITAVSQRITFSGGCLGSSSDEARSEARYAWRCAEIRDLKVFECTAPRGYARGTSGSASRYDFSVCLNIRGRTIAHHRGSCGAFSLLTGMWDPILVMTLSLPKGPTPGILCPQEGTPPLGLNNGTGPELRLGYPLNLSI